MIVIHGGHFSSLDRFYEEVPKVLMKDTDYRIISDAGMMSNE